MSDKIYIPTAVFDTIEEVISQYKTVHDSDQPHVIIRQWLSHCFVDSGIDLPNYAVKDYQVILNFLYSYRGSHDTFVAYRRELERFLQWSWFVHKQSVLKHKREDIEAFIEFCICPYKRWIGLKKVARFKLIDGLKTPNSEWRPFEAYVSKKDHKAGKKPTKNDYQFSQASLKVMFGILSSFYKYLLQEEIVQANPVLLIRQKSKFMRKETTPAIRRLSNKQWQMVIGLAKEEAQKDKQQDNPHERAVFILSCLYSMYLRISELTAKKRWSPTMGDFFQDNAGNWWFKTVGKGNKARQIALGDDMLNALKHYRTKYLNLSPYPLPNEKTPLISHQNDINKPITNEKPVSQLVQKYFDLAADRLDAINEHHEANILRTATVHWLRHTGISEDVKIRPREHVRDDAGHSSSAITDRYIDVELLERAKSAKNKAIDRKEKKPSKN